MISPPRALDDAFANAEKRAILPPGIGYRRRFALPTDMANAKNMHKKHIFFT